MNKIKITKSQLKSLIQEEAKRYRRVIELEQKKENIVAQLNEMYEQNHDIEMEEGVFGNLFSKPNPEEKRAQMKQMIDNHPHFSDTAQYWAAQTNQPLEVVENQLIDFFVKHAVVADGKLKGVNGGITYDTKTMQFVNRTPFSGASGAMDAKL